MSEEEKEALWYCSKILANNENDIEHWEIVEKLIDKLQNKNEMLKALLKQAQEDVKIWKDMYKNKVGDIE